MLRGNSTVNRPDPLSAPAQRRRRGYNAESDEKLVVEKLRASQTTEQVPLGRRDILCCWLVRDGRVIKPRGAYNKRSRRPSGT